MAKCLATASSFAIQQYIIEIIYAYCEHAENGQSHLHAIIKKISLRTDDIDALVKFPNNYEAIKWFLYHFNQRLPEQTIFSEMVKSLRIDEKIIHFDEVGNAKIYVPIEFYTI